MKKIWAAVTIIRTSTRMRALGALPGTFIPYEEEEIREYREQRFLFGDEKKIAEQIRELERPDNVSLEVVLLFPDGRKKIK